MKPKKLIWITVFALVATALVAGLYQYNRKPEGVDHKSGLPIKAATLVESYQQNEDSANKQFLSKVLCVTGTIAEVNKNEDGKTVLFLEGNDPLSGVQCTMRDLEVGFTVGKPVTIKGFCNGYTMAVVLSDCITQNKTE